MLSVLSGTTLGVLGVEGAGFVGRGLVGCVGRVVGATVEGVVAGVPVGVVVSFAGVLRQPANSAPAKIRLNAITAYFFIGITSFIKLGNQDYYAPQAAIYTGNCAHRGND